MLRQVAAGVDGSPESLAAAHWAAREAVRRGTALRLVHAGERHRRPTASVPADASRRAGDEDLPARLADGLRAAHPGLEVVGESVADPPVTALLAAADRAELLALGSRGLGGVAGFLVGSVSQRVIARASGPVVLVRAGEGAAGEHFSAQAGISPDEIPEIPYRDVVLGLDDPDRPCDRVIEFAFDTARHRRAALRVVHAFRAPSGLTAAGASPGAGDPDRLAEREHAVLAALRPWRDKYPGVSTAALVTDGRAADGLIRASAAAGLVVLGRRTREPRAGARFGAVGHAVLHHAACPVAVVPHD